MCIIGDHDVDRLSSVIQPTANPQMAREKLAAAILLDAAVSADHLRRRRDRHGRHQGLVRLRCQRHPLARTVQVERCRRVPMSNYHVLNSAAYNARVSREYEWRSVQEQQGVSTSRPGQTYRTLIAARKNSIALRRGSYSPAASASPAVWAFLRHDPAQSVLVAINLSTSTSTPRSTSGALTSRAAAPPPPTSSRAFLAPTSPWPTAGPTRSRSALRRA